MNADIAIRIDGLSKEYRIGARRKERYRTLRQSISEGAMAPVRAAKSLFSRGAASESSVDESIWALKDVSFEVARGDVVGIIGSNGAGKSTLLKILSRITDPTSGFADVAGRVGSLLEVGTGFHQELTGRENIYLNGAILGMRKPEIERKFDEIVAFAEVEQFIDTPVKRYSSGMYLRLAFAVAAHLEPDILLVDEVLAVGDISFQKKCLGKLGDAASHGRTVLFVSHNMAAIRSMCRRGIVLSNGMLQSAGDVGSAIEAYYRLVGALPGEDGESGEQELDGAGFGVVRLDCDGSTTVAQGKPFSVSTTFRLNEDVGGFSVVCELRDIHGHTVFSLRKTNADLGLMETRAGDYDVKLGFPALWLNAGIYTMFLKVVLSGAFSGHRYVSNNIPFDVDGNSSQRRQALLHPTAAWDVSVS